VLRVENVTLLAAFVAGILSFISPCVLPLVPGYLSFVSGTTLDQMRAGGAVAPRARRHVFVASLAFVLGFSLVFIGLGASASALGQLLMEHLSLLGRLAGLLIIVFGLHTMGLLRLRWLYAEKRIQTERKPAGPLGAMLVGIAFAFGWTPCIGPILGAILVVAGSQDTIGEGVRLLAVYSLGLGIPFLVTSLAVNQFFSAFAQIRRYYHAIEVASGLLLVAIGVLVFTNRLTLIAQWLTPYLPVY
jgi:cytochrome c-type biogenesis protein